MNGQRVAGVWQTRHAGVKLSFQVLSIDLCEPGQLIQIIFETILAMT